MTPEEAQNVFEGGAPEAAPAQPVFEPVEPPKSRFLFVDVAALRAKQLRRGALPRLETASMPQPLKPERIAMEEVRKGLVPFELPEFRPFENEPN
ncbi:MAG TPA: DNA-directed RNA polymerase subunit omega [Vicinamibacterales bacterium]